MSWEIGEGEIERLLALPAQDRARQFVQLVVDWEEAWGLKDSQGWVVSKETDALPLWPHADFAHACAGGSWEGAQPASVDLGELLDDLLPILEEDGLRVALFPSPDDPGVILAPSELRERLEVELALGE